jgi:dUTP pyrophosphatase
MKVKVLDSKATIPEYAHHGDAGLDIFSIEDVTLAPGERRAIRTGLAMAIPEGHVGLVWDKSGLALNRGLKTMGGVIDSNYRGELQIILCNLSDTSYEVKTQTKIAQLLIQKIEHVSIEVVEDIGITTRGEGRFGSTGLTKKDKH